jgi:2-phosphosulfolactate phosphatase
LRACAHAKMVLAAAFLNLSATADFLRRQKLETVVLICAGTGENSAFEDVLAAGALCDAFARGKKPPALSDSARIAMAAFRQAKGDLAELISESENARRLLAMPELREDVQFCLQRDVIDLVATMKRGKITVLRK